MHDHRVANPASYPHERTLLHPPLHSPGGARLHPPRTLLTTSGDLDGVLELGGHGLGKRDD